ncbi:MAG: hypothetical protein GMKNLPBB_00717 [Myxococcota bacterium]|nr:hypothetical protein [Myxococcota bacterium]
MSGRLPPAKTLLWWLCGVTACVGVIGALGRLIPVFGPHSGALISLLLFVSAVAAAHRYQLDNPEIGLTLERPRVWAVQALAWFVITAVPWTPLFLAWSGLMKTGGWTSAFTSPQEWINSFQREWAAFQFRLPDGFAGLALSQVLAVALPEELFYRGLVQGHLERCWPARRRLWGAPVGRALLATSAVFAAGHVISYMHPQQAGVFFPALLYGWLRARSGGVAAPVLVHAGHNLWAAVMWESVWR